MGTTAIGSTFSGVINVLNTLEAPISEEEFAKRKGGLLKKAYELNVLCDAEIAVIIRDKKGVIYECVRPAARSRAPTH